jgi:hypothetical protein
MSKPHLSIDEHDCRTLFQRHSLVICALSKGHKEVQNCRKITYKKAPNLPHLFEATVKPNSIEPAFSFPK